MARAPANFKELLWDIARMCQLQPDPAITGGGLTAQQTDEVLLDLNEGYEQAYGWNNTSWEDAWKSAALTPTNGVISYAQIEDASLFTLYTKDPRPEKSGAELVSYKSSDAGLHLQGTYSSVYAFWLPVCPRFSAAAYNAGTAYNAGAVVMAADGQVYKALRTSTGATPSSSPLDWRLQPLLQVLRKAALTMALANRATREAKHGEARKMVADAEAKLDDQAALEFPRVSSWWWIRRTQN